MMRRNTVKQKLAAGKPAFGTWLMAISSPAMPRMIAAAGFDFVFIDTQHSPFSIENVATLCEVARACGVVPIVRPFQQEQGFINRLQDVGAMGLMVPDITSRAEVDRLRGWLHYPPAGTRGASYGSASYDYVLGAPRDLTPIADANTMLTIQIESRAGAEAIDAILAGGGVDLVEIGRNDLSASYGFPGQIDHPEVVAAIDAIIAACKAHGVAAGVNCISMDDARAIAARGVTCLSYSTDKRILTEAYHGIMRHLSAISLSP